jgi:ribosomal protein S18 acetylase RimI-like enzyme
MIHAIRRCSPADASRLALVGQATFLETYAGIVDGGDILLHGQKTHSPDSYAALAADPAVDLYLAVMAPDDAPVGFAMVSPPDLPVTTGPDDLELRRIYVLHRFHGEGLGPRLMQTAIDRARERGARRLLLGAYGENHRAIAFYRRTGFVQVGTRIFHVGQNDYDDVVLALEL